MKELTTIKAAIFDMDGVLFDTEALYQASWREIAEECGIALEEGFANEISGTNGERMKRVIERFYHVEDGTDIIARCGVKMRQKLHENVPMKPGVVEILEDFKAHGMKIAIASSSAREQIEHNISFCGIGDYFDEVVCGHDVANGKPAPDIFITAAKALGYDPHECFVFEDSANGIAAGHAAGCYVIMVPDQIQPDDATASMCDRICESLGEADRFIFKR
jgi:HAD superfamily hydrolase (TIGR01509 family)